MKRIANAILYLLLITASVSLAQIAQGPATGSIPGGVILSTDNFYPGDHINKKMLELNRHIIQEPYYIDYGFSTEFDGSNYFEDTGTNSQLGINRQPILIQDFQGFQMGNYIPPDPDLAAGPNHIIAIDNGQFGIWDKLGNLLKNINADSWVSAIVNNPSVVTDPKILYDHYEGRWVMVWLTVNDIIQESYWTISVSDDSDPLGIWYNWATPSDQNGSTSTNSFGDYEGVGFDEDAIYITGNFFSYAGFYEYTKIRIIPKAQLYFNNAGPVNWTDFWEIKTPTGFDTFGIRPVHHYGSSSQVYFVYADNGGGNTMTVIKINDPIGSPTISGVNIPVTSYSSPPNTNQLGGGSPPIDNGGADILYEPIFKNGFLYVVHTVRNPTSSLYSALRYVKIDVTSNSAAEDIFFGSIGCYYVYATIAIDLGNNVAFGFGRSADDEYMGAYYATRLASDPPGTINGSYTLKEGQGNYVVTYGGNRNRWGDYQGIFLDPATGNIWMHSEYVSGTDTWGTWIGEIRMSALQGVVAYTATPVIDFHNVEVGTTSSTFTAKLTSLGEDPLEITNIPFSVGPFQITNIPGFPITLNTNESILLDFVFIPPDTGYFEALYPIISNDPNFPGFTMMGRGYTISTVTENILYGYSGAAGDGKLISIDRVSGLGSVIGPAFRDDLKGISINSLDSKLYGMTSNEFETKLFWIDASSGVASEILTIDIGNIEAIAFDKTGKLYGAIGTGGIYFINISTGGYTLTSDSHISISGMAFNLLTNELYACTPVGFGRTNDKIYLIDVNTGFNELIGNTGFHPSAHNSLAFDENDNLYCAIGSSTSIGELIKVDVNTGSGTLIGSIGYKNLTGMALLPEGISSGGDETTSLPKEFNLNQNYPNPFNPSTTIKYQIPRLSFVTLNVYDVLGNEVALLVNEEKPAGKYRVEFRIANLELSSGIYFYQLRTGEFVESKKMVLLK